MGHSEAHINIEVTRDESGNYDGSAGVKYTDTNDDETISVETEVRVKPDGEGEVKTSISIKG